MPAPDGTGKELGFSASYNVTWGLSFHVCEIGILLSSPSFTTMGKKCDNTLQMAYYNTNYEIRYDDDNDDDENDVRLLLFFYSFNEKIMSTFSVLSIALGSGVTKESKTHMVPSLMELAAQQGDRLKAARHINK